MVTKQIIHYLTIAFSLLWILLIVTDYLYYHPIYFLSIINFKYLDLVGVNIFIGGVVGYFVVNKNKTSIKFPLINGIGISLLFLLISTVIIKIQSTRLATINGVPFSDILTYTGTLSIVLLSTYSIYLVCYCLGNFLLLKMSSLRYKPLEESLISIAIGIILLSVLLLIAASFSQLTFIPISIFFLLIPILLWKHTLQFVRITFFNNIFKSKQIGWLGFVCFYIILLIISRNCLQNVRPIPFGFDALRLYLNLPKLLAERGEIIAGHSPYYWSLFISLGHVLFDKTEIVISLSSSGGILSAFSIYAISNKWLSRDSSLFVVLLFMSLPMVNFLLSSDVKDDLGLLFTHLVIFLIFINYLEFPKYSISKKRLVQNKRSLRKTKKKGIIFKLNLNPKNSLLNGLVREDTQLIIVMGLITGGSLGIKLTTLILIFSIVSILFFFKTNSVGFITSILLVFAFILIAGLDVGSGLRAYHLGTHWLKWILLGIGLLGLIYIMYKYKSKAVELFKICTIYGAIITLVYLPWPIKNYSETKVLSFETFIKGKELRAPPIE